MSDLDGGCTPAAKSMMVSPVVNISVEMPLCSLPKYCPSIEPQSAALPFTGERGDSNWNLVKFYQQFICAF